MPNVSFNILVVRLHKVRLHKAFMKIISDRGILFSIAYDVKIAGTPSVLT